MQFLTLCVPRTVTNYTNKSTRCTFSMYLFYNLCTTPHVSNDHFVHHREFMIYCICSSVQTVQTCLTAWSYGWNYNLCTTLHVSNDHFVQTSPNRKTKQLNTFARFVQSCKYSKSRIPDDERNGLSKHVELYINCRINTYRMCILLVCLHNPSVHVRWIEERKNESREMKHWMYHSALLLRICVSLAVQLLTNTKKLRKILQPQHNLRCSLSSINRDLRSFLKSSKLQFTLTRTSSYFVRFCKISVYCCSPVEGFP